MRATTLKKAYAFIKQLFTLGTTLNSGNLQGQTMENIRFKENKFSYFSNGIYTNWLIVKQFRPRPLMLVRNERMNI